MTLVGAMAGIAVVVALGFVPLHAQTTTSIQAIIIGQDTVRQTPNNISISVDSASAKATIRLSDRSDSLFRAAREAMVAGDNSTAVQFFDLIARRYPRSPNATAALYYKAFLLYRQYKPGQLAPLKRALSSLQRLERNYPKSPQAADGRILQGRICGELGQHGDSYCIRLIEKQATSSPMTITMGTIKLGSGNVPARKVVTGRASHGKSTLGDSTSGDSTSLKNHPASCPAIDSSADAYITALNSLWKVDTARAMAISSHVLLQRDPCTLRVREQTLLTVMKRPTPVLGMTHVLFQLARDDSEPTIKRLATIWLLSQEWDTPTASFFHSVFGEKFREKSHPQLKNSTPEKIRVSDSGVNR